MTQPASPRQSPRPAAGGAVQSKYVWRAYASIVCALLGMIWVFVGDDTGKLNTLLAFPSLVFSVLAIVFAMQSIRRTRRVVRGLSIAGLVIGSAGGLLSGIHVVFAVGFIVILMAMSA